MASRRTKKDKIIANLRRQVQYTDSDSDLNYSFPEHPAVISQTASIPVTFPKTSDSWLALFSYDPAYVKRDLFKTTILTILVFIIEFGIYFWWR